MTFDCLLRIIRGQHPNTPHFDWSGHSGPTVRAGDVGAGQLTTTHFSGVAVSREAHLVCLCEAEQGVPGVQAQRQKSLSLP